jgi:hypothetical protein
MGVAPEPLKDLHLMLLGINILSLSYALENNILSSSHALETNILSSSHALEISILSSSHALEISILSSSHAFLRTQTTWSAHALLGLKFI